MTHHTAGPVQYRTEGFLEKNRDSLSHTIQQLLQKSSIGVVRHIFSDTFEVYRSAAAAAAAAADASLASSSSASSSSASSSKAKAQKNKAGRKGSSGDGDQNNKSHRRAPTMGSNFKASLSNLVGKMDASTPHFVRCIKPNVEKKPTVFTDDFVMSQLRYAGVLQTVQIRRDGYPCRLQFEEFVRRYGMLGSLLPFGSEPPPPPPPASTNPADAATPPPPPPAALTPAESVRAACSAILAKVGLPPTSTNAGGAKANNWELGSSMIFLKYFIVDGLSSLVQKQHQSAVVVQCAVRQLLARKVATTRRVEREKRAKEEAERKAAEEAAARAKAEAEKAAAEAAAKAKEEAEKVKAEAEKAAEIERLASEEAAAAKAADEAERKALAAEGYLNNGSGDGDGDEIDEPYANNDDLFGPGAAAGAVAGRGGGGAPPPPPSTFTATASFISGKKKSSSDEGSRVFMGAASVQSIIQNVEVTDTAHTSSSNDDDGSAGDQATLNRPPLQPPGSAATVLRAAREEKRARNADRQARRDARAVRQQAKAAKELEEADRERKRAAEKLAAKSAKPELLLLPWTGNEAYNKLEQNFVGVERIPEGVAHLNRYTNILPNPRTRVRLEEVEGEGETSRYINANYIQGYEGTPQSYIACQGPLPVTVDSFWRMVWEKNCRSIVMVTGLREKGIEKCARYWPTALFNNDENCGDVQFGGINVSIMAGYRKEGFITSKFRVKNGEEEREVWHFWYDSWPDHGVPKVTAPVVAMLKACREFSDESDQPWVVHCSAGIGRTGSFIAVDHGLRQFETTGTVDVLDIVSKIRKDRGGMVQHAEQAEFVHRTLKQYVVEHAGDDIHGTVLRKTLQKVIVSTPKGVEVHPSQIDTEEGADDQLPSWRAKQIEIKEARKRAMALGLEEEQGDSGDASEDDYEEPASTMTSRPPGEAGEGEGGDEKDRRAKRVNARDAERERKKRAAEALLADETGVEDFLSQVATLRIGQHRKSVSGKKHRTVYTDDENDNDGDSDEDGNGKDVVFSTLRRESVISSDEEITDSDDDDDDSDDGGKDVLRRQPTTAGSNPNRVTAWHSPDAGNAGAAGGSFHRPQLKRHGSDLSGKQNVDWVGNVDGSTKRVLSAENDADAPDTLERIARASANAVASAVGDGAGVADDGAVQLAYAAGEPSCCLSKGPRHAGFWLAFMVVVLVGMQHGATMVNNVLLLIDSANVSAAAAAAADAGADASSAGEAVDVGDGSGSYDFTASDDGGEDAGNVAASFGNGFAKGGEVSPAITANHVGSLVVYGVGMLLGTVGFKFLERKASARVGVFFTVFVQLFGSLLWFLTSHVAMFILSRLLSGLAFGSAVALGCYAPGAPGGGDAAPAGHAFIPPVASQRHRVRWASFVWFALALGAFFGALFALAFSAVSPLSVLPWGSLKSQYVLPALPALAGIALTCCGIQFSSAACCKSVTDPTKDVPEESAAAVAAPAGALPLVVILLAEIVVAVTELALPYVLRTDTELELAATGIHGVAAALWAPLMIPPALVAWKYHRVSHVEASVCFAAVVAMCAALAQLTKSPAGFAVGAVVAHLAMHTAVFCYVISSLQAGATAAALQQLVMAAAGWVVGPLLAAAACSSADSCSGTRITILVVPVSALCALFAAVPIVRRRCSGSGSGSGDRGGSNGTAELLELEDGAGSGGGLDIAPDDPAYHDPVDVVVDGSALPSTTSQSSRSRSSSSSNSSNKPIVHVAVNTAF